MPKNHATGHTIEAEIFSTGTWNGETFTREHLVEIASNFRRLRSHLKPPLKFGHDESQTLIGQRDGDPALGWVEGLRAVGDRLVATFGGVPRVVFDAIRARRYKRVSAEIYFNVRWQGKNLGKALKAVALLGADLPAVTNLEDLTAFLTDRPVQDLQVGDPRSFGLAIGNTGLAPLITEEDPMDDLQQQQGPETELEELRAYKALQEQREQQDQARLRAAGFRAARGDAENFCREQVSAGRLSPQFCRRLLAEINGQAQPFSEGGGLKVSFAWVRDFVRDCRSVLPRGEVAFSEAALENPAGEEENPSVALSRLATAKMVEMNLGYGQAAEYVLKTNPALAKAYRDYTINPTMGG